MPIINLNTTIELFKSYSETRVKAEPNQLVKSLFVEGTQRLQQVNFLLERANILEAAIGVGALLLIPDNSDSDSAKVEIYIPDILRSKKANHIIEDKTGGELLLEFTTAVESIYYFAWRFVKICHTENVGLKKFNPKGIREVRNKLIEHPNTVSGLSGNFSITSENGYHLRTTMNEVSQSIEIKGKIIDKGLKSNVEEFKSDLEHLLNLRLSGK